MVGIRFGTRAERQLDAEIAGEIRWLERWPHPRLVQAADSHLNDNAVPGLNRPGRNSANAGPCPTGEEASRAVGSRSANVVHRPSRSWVASRKVYGARTAVAVHGGYGCAILARLTPEVIDERVSLHR
jgi:hypothetical protein